MNRGQLLGHAFMSLMSLILVACGMFEFFLGDRDSGFRMLVIGLIFSMDNKVDVLVARDQMMLAEWRTHVKEQNSGSKTGTDSTGNNSNS